jgi:hypothetical protein
MDMGSIAAALGSLKAAGDIAKALISLKTMTEVQSMAIELNTKIIDAQHQIFSANTAQAALVERIRELEGQIARMKDWDAQKQRYQLVIPYSGIPVYALKKSMSDGENPHYLCANCFEGGKRSFLQHVTKQSGFITIACSTCRFEGHTRWRGIGPDKYAEDVTETT